MKLRSRDCCETAQCIAPVLLRGHRTHEVIGGCAAQVFGFDKVEVLVGSHNGDATTLSSSPVSRLLAKISCKTECLDLQHTSTFFLKRRPSMKASSFPTRSFAPTSRNRLSTFMPDYERGRPSTEGSSGVGALRRQHLGKTEGE